MHHTLSEQILATLPEDDPDLKPNRERGYRWTWQVLLGNLPRQTLEAMLTTIEVAAMEAMPQFRLELAWKAQVIEVILVGLQ